MTLTEIKIELIKQGKTATWLSQQLGYSSAYMYRVIDEQKQSEINKIKEILKGGK